jgi:hypothetical protein
MRATKRIFRDVVKVEAHYNPGYEKSKYVGGSNYLTLSCGHGKRRKFSQSVPHRVVCTRCEEEAT